MLADGPMLIAAHPILTSQGEGPPAGALIMGRWLDAHELARLQEMTRLPLKIARFDDPALPADLRSLAATLTPEQPVAVTALDEQLIRGITHVPDLHGGPGVLLTLDLPREIHQLGRQTSYTYTLVLIGAGLLLTATVLWMLERIVLSRIIRLSNEVAAVDHHRPQAGTSISGNDEIGRLGEAINATLRRLAQARQQLAENERRYRQLIELLPDAVLVHNGKNIHYANAAATLLLGSDGSASLVGQPVPPAIGAVVPHSNGTPVLVDRQLTAPDGATIEVELVVLSFHDRGVPAIQTIIRNITERKQTEQALRAAKEAADAANLAKSRFLATMSHELRTPLTAILGYTELLECTLATMAPAETIRDLASIRMAGNHLLAIINDILDLSKIEAGMMQIRPNPLAVAPLIQRVVDTVQPIATRNRNRIVVQTTDAVPIVVSDELRLQQILVNPAGNACKFTEDGTVTIEVSQQPAGDGHPAQVSFAIHDTGIGISPEHLKDLFRDFAQVDSSSTRKYGGTGLGLALSQRLARLLGGEISVVSAPGVGSTFTLTLPQRLEVDCQPVAVTPVGHSPEETSSTQSPLAGDPHLETRIILVIDDDPMIRDLLPRALAQPDLHFETAANGEEGLELATALLPDLIILDLFMPGVDGWNVLRQLKANPATAAIPVVLLTIDSEGKRGLVLGAAACLHKPVEIGQLTRMIASLLQDGTPPQRVLLVEDDGALRNYLQRVLSEQGWEVDTAPDGVEALALFDQRVPDVAIVDLMLPRMDGITLIGNIRTRPDGETLPILVVTAKELAPHEHEFLNHSVENILRKGSFRGDDLLRSVRALIGRQRQKNPSG